MSIVPKTLRARLTLLLLGVLLVAQMLGAALHFRDRGEVLKHAAGYNAAQRIAGIVKILDALQVEQREIVVRGLDFPPTRVRLHDEPEKYPSTHHDSPRVELFHQLLHFRLGRDRPVLVYLPDAGQRRASTPDQIRRPIPSMVGPMHHMMWHEGGSVKSGDLNFVIQVQLVDGKWVSFAYLLPAELAAWPWDLLVALLILLAGVLLVSFLAVRWLSKPLSTLSEAADELGKDIRHPPLPEGGSIEVARAARAFNTMQRRLARFVEERTRILAAISHDLKTPITRMRLRTEKIADPAVRNKFDADLLEMQTMVQSTLDFMHGIALREASEPLDVVSLLDSLAEDARELGADVSVHAHALRPYSAKPLALKRALANLIDNAVRYGEQVQIEAHDSAQQLTIAIHDDGPGVPTELLEKVMEPFFRVDESRSSETGGSGLGLSIASNIVRGHGGELSISNRQPHGLDVLVSLPR